MNFLLFLLYGSAAYLTFLSFVNNPGFYSLSKYVTTILNIVYFILLGLINYFYFRNNFKTLPQTFIYLLTVLGYLALAYALFACFTRDFHIVALNVCVGSFFYILSDGIGYLQQENDNLKRDLILASIREEDYLNMKQENEKLKVQNEDLLKDQS